MQTICQSENILRELELFKIQSRIKIVRQIWVGLKSEKEDLRMKTDLLNKTALTKKNLIIKIQVL